MNSQPCIFYWLKKEYNIKEHHARSGSKLDLESVLIYTVKTGPFSISFPPNSPFTDYGLVKQILRENSVCLLTQICLCYYVNAIFPYQNTNCVGSTFSNALILPQYNAENGR